MQQEKESKPSECSNCGTPFPTGAKFCYICGQQNKSIDISFWELMKEFFSSTFNFDTKLAHTFWDLLRKPGEITVQFINGKRARYVSPLQLYLFVSFIFFVIPAVEESSQTEIPKVQVESDTTNSELGHLSHKLMEQDPNLAKAYEENARLATVLNFLDKMVFAINSIDRQMESNPALVEKFESDASANLSRSMFLLLPVFAVFLWFLVRKSDPYYMHSIIFSLHFHTVLFLLLAVNDLTDFVWMTGVKDAIIYMAILIYLLLALKRVFNLSWGKTIWKSIVLLFSYSTVVFLVLIGVAIITVYNTFY